MQINLVAQSIKGKYVPDQHAIIFQHEDHTKPKLVLQKPNLNNDLILQDPAEQQDIVKKHTAT